MEVKKTIDGHYQIDGSQLSNLTELPGSVQALKKPIPIWVCKVNEPFSVDTTEGVMSGRTGDWLMQGVNGELYICPADVFDNSYDVLAS